NVTVRLGGLTVEEKKKRAKKKKDRKRKTKNRKRGRQAVEEKRKDEKKRGETRKKQGLTFGLYSILSANKICRTEEKKVQKTRRKRGDRNRERRKESLFGYQRRESRSSVHQL
ncbi:hypothetical protein D5086_027093, partial [Populus alba]